MTLSDLCRMIDLPESVAQAVLKESREEALREAERHAELLGDRRTWPDGVRAIAAALGDDPAGMKMLAFMLLQALRTHQRYVAAGVDDQIFVDTMKFCTRFVVDHYRNHGSYAFTWGWWLPRQLSLNEFRVGALEYELVGTEDHRSISIHIPGDADLSRAALQDSHQRARALIGRVAPVYADADMVCDSWMLSPTLSELLPPSSRILAFASAFQLTSIDPANRHAIRWIFGRDHMSPDDMPEGTSLQRRAKALYQAGGNIGAAVGTLRPGGWDEPTAAALKR